MNFPIQKNFTSLQNSNSFSMGKSNMMERDNIYAQYKPALSRENSMNNQFQPSNLSLVVEPKKMEFDIMMR